MPIPHRVQKQMIQRRLVGKVGGERIKELRSILTELPDYKNGPYADLRKWVERELEATRTRKRVVHRDSIAVRREGAAQIALVGPPNAGKSSLLQALSAIQILTGDYAFTTTRPVAATTRLGGVLVQLVEIPGLIEGAAEDRGGGRALLGVLRNADAILWINTAATWMGPPGGSTAIDAWGEVPPGDLVERTVKAHTRLTVKAIRAAPLIDRLADGDTVAVVGGYYSLDTGAVSILD